MKEQVIKILQDIKNDIDYDNCKTLIDDGELTSLDVLQVIAALSEEFDVMIKPSEIKPKNFNSVDGIVTMLERLIDDDE